MIQVFKPDVGAKEWESLREVFASGWIGLGPKVAEFEQAFARRVGSKYAIAMNSATAALHLSLLALHVADEVLVPSLTFVSTVHAISYVDAIPVFVDVDPETLLMDLDDAESKVTSWTRAIIPVHYGGRPCDMERVARFAAKESLVVIEDAAHACGSSYRTYPIGAANWSDVVCFSYHAIKNMTTGDGGMVTTNSAELDESLRRLRWCGIDKSTWIRTNESQKRPRWYYEVKELGYKYHMNDIAAAIGLVQLNKLTAMNRRREEIALQYIDAFSKLPWVKMPTVPENSHSSWHNFVVMVSDREDLAEHLLENGIETGVHYMPVHMHPFYENYEADVPVTDAVWEKLITLPLHPKMTNVDVRVVVSAMEQYDG